MLIQTVKCIEVNRKKKQHFYIAFTVKKISQIYGKYWLLAASTCTVNFTGTCRLFTVIITHGRVVYGKVGNVYDKVGMCATTPYLKLTHPYPILRGNCCKRSTEPRRWQPVASIYCKVHGIFLQCARFKSLLYSGYNITCNNMRDNTVITIR